MDVTEVLNFKPTNDPTMTMEESSSNSRIPRKRGRLDYGSDPLQPDSKRSSQIQLPPATGASSSGVKKSILSSTKEKPKEIHAIISSAQASSSGLSMESAEERQMRLLEEVESRVQNDGNGLMDEHKVKQLILSFEKKACRNQEMRIKFSEKPEKFMDSELDLNDAILEMKSLSTMPTHYHYIVELMAVKSLLNLLSHPNSDIACSVIELLQELTDNEDALEDEDNEKDGTNMLIVTLISSKVCALLVQNMERLDELVPQEATGIFSSLSLFENILETKPEASVTFANEGLLTWLLKRLRSKIPFNANRLYVSEILSILLQNDEMYIKQKLGDNDGIDVILQQLAAYKRHDPGSVEEVECMENLFNCLCAALLHVPNLDKFLKGEGVQLMCLMLREKHISRNSALKVLNHSLSGVNGTLNCHKFMDVLGHRALFPLFMRPPKKNKKCGITRKDHEEHIVSIIAALLQNLKGSNKKRVLDKFLEKNLVKCERLVELHFQYLKKVKHEEANLKRQQAQLMELVENDEEELEEMFYLRKLEAGLFTLQHIDYIILDLSATDSLLKKTLHRLINLKGGSAEPVRAVLREFASRYDDSVSSSANVLKQKILSLADKF